MRNKMKSAHGGKKKGFTLIELVVVMAIIAVLSVLIIGAITVARRMSTETANRGTAKSVQTGLEAYFGQHKAYPASSGTVSFHGIVNNADATGALNGMVTLQGEQCTGDAVAAEWKGGGHVEYTATGYLLHIADYKCDTQIEEIKNS